MRIVISVLLVTFAMTIAAGAQNLSPEVQAAGKSAEQAFDNNLKGWTRKGPIVPVYPGENVFIEFWTMNDRSVKVAIMPLRSDYKSGDLLREPTPGGKKLEGVGDEAIQFGYGDKTVWFVRPGFYVAVSSEVELNLLCKTKEENEALSLTEAAATSRLIACFVNLALSGDLSKHHRPGDGFLSRPCERELVRKGLIDAKIFTQF